MKQISITKYVILSLVVIIAVGALFYALGPLRAALTTGKSLGDLNQGLVGWWTFDEDAGTFVQDHSGNGNNGTATNGPTSADGKLGRGLSFDGTTGHKYVKVNDSNSLDLTTDGTISFWIKVNSYATSQWPDILTKFGDGYGNGGTSACGDYAGYQVCYNTSGQAFNINIRTSAGWNTASFGKPATGAWSLLTGVWSGGVVSAYLNGNLANSAAITGTLAANTGYLSFGAKDYSGTTNGMIFDMDDVRIYNRALSADEIKRLYDQSGRVKMSSGLDRFDFDFENTPVGSCPAGWTCTGDAGVKAMGTGCGGTTGGSGANYLHLGCDNTTGTATTPPFTLPPNTSYISFLRAGGANSPDGLSVVRESDGTTLCLAANGADTNTLFTDESCNNLEQYGGQRVVIKVVNNIVSGWGKVQIDDIKLKNASGITLPPLSTFINTSPKNRLTNGLVGYWTFDGKDTSWTSGTAGTVADVSGSGNTGTLTNMSQSSSPTIGKFGQGMKFDGVDDYVDITYAGLKIAGDHSWSMWIKADASAANDRLISSGSTAANQWAGFSSNSLRFNVFGTGGEQDFQTTATYNDGLWHHVVFRFEASQDVQIWVDGAKQAGTFFAQNTVSSSNYATDIVIGIWDTDKSSIPFGGGMDDVRIYNRALTKFEIKQLYRMGR